MRILCLSAKNVFSGFESTFFSSLLKEGNTGRISYVEAPLFKLFCTVSSFKPNRSLWGLSRDLKYHTTIRAFKEKSRIAAKIVKSRRSDFDLIYQVGALWNPALHSPTNLPIVLQLDYTSRLSEVRGSEWKRKPGKEANYWFEVEKVLYQKAAAICATTKNAKDSLVEDYGVDEKKVCVVGAGVSGQFEEHSDNKKANYDSKRILFVGKGYKGKGLDTLLKAFEIVRKKAPDACLTIIGPSRAIEGPGIEYHYRINDKSLLRDIFYQSSIFVMPSIFEPFGQVFIEAMSCQLPCIGTTLDAMPEIIEDGITGYTIEPSDYRMLAERLIRLLESPLLKEEMGVAGYKKLKRTFVWPVVGAKISETCQRALKMGSPV